LTKSLVIHIGDQKAGSTSIQATLAKGGITSPDAKLFYPTKFNHRPLASTLMLKDKFKNRADKFKNIGKRLDKSDADVGVISAERFERVDPHLLHETLEKFLPQYLGNLRIIAYVRPHADRLVSSWAQQIKSKYTGSLTEFYDKYHAAERLNFSKRLDSWSSVFGDAFHARPMIRSHLHGGSAVPDFAKFCFQSDNFEVKEEEANSSLFLEELALLRMIQLMDDEGQKQKRWASPLGAMVARNLESSSAIKDGTKPRIHLDLLSKLQADYSPDAAAIDEKYFDGSPMSDALANAKHVSEPQSINPEDHFSADEIRFYTALLTGAKDMASIAPVKMANHLRPMSSAGGFEND